MAKITARMKDLTGQRFGRLTVLEFAGRKKSNYYWKCRCDCGRKTVVQRSGLMIGNSRSCGCLKAETASCFHRKHGESRRIGRTKEYRIWGSIIQRCTNPKDKGYKNYGGRGIKVCDCWRSYENFIADMGKCPPGLEIDRINNDGNYSPENSRWTTHKVQNRNSRRNVFIKFQGERLCIQDWANRLGVSHAAIRSRFRRGLTTKEVLSKNKYRNSNRNIIIDRDGNTLADLVRSSEISRAQFDQKRKRGWSFPKILQHFGVESCHTLV